MTAVIYRRRHSALSRGEREWRVEEGGLASIGASGHVRRWAWKEFISVRLCHEPTRLKPWRYTFHAQFRNGEKISIDNGHYVGPGRFEERSEAYAPFVRTLLARLHEANPKLRALIGETQKRYFFLMLAALLALCVLAYVLIAVRTPLDSLPYAGAVKLVLILAMLPVFWRWVARAMPRGVALDAIPERALPPPPGESGGEAKNSTCG
jgi:hypothetical protein